MTYVIQRKMKLAVSLLMDCLVLEIKSSLVQLAKSYRQLSFLQNIYHCGLIMNNMLADLSHQIANMGPHSLYR